MSTVLEPSADAYEFRGNLALGEEQKTIVDWQAKIADHYWRPVSRQLNNPRLRFYALSSQWKEETRFVSLISQMTMNSSYQQIISMGSLAIPLILEELKKKPAYWFWALKTISGFDPVPPQFKGHIEKMSIFWLEWGKEQGYVN